jgi:glucose/arabinose dehydrogenase
MKKPSITKSLIALLLFFSPYCLFSQTFIGTTNNPADNTALPGPTVAVTPPGGTQAGDLIVIFAQYRGALAANSMTILATGGQAWNTATNPAGANNQTFGIFWCRFNGTWGPNPSVTVGAGTNGMSVIMYVYRPTNSNNGWAVNVGPTNGSITNTAINITPGLTTTVTNTVTMAFWASPAANTWNTLTAGWTKPGSPPTQIRNTQGAPNSQSQTAAYKIMAAAGATGAVSQTQTTSQATQTSIISWAEGTPPANDLCANAVSLSSQTSCSTTAGSLTYASYTTGGGLPGCGPVTHDVWYSFVAQTTNPTITVGGALANPRFQIFSGSCGSLTSVMCSGSGSQAAAGLTIGSTYYLRAYSNTNASGAFTICITDPAPSNNTCATATILTPGATCTNVAGNLAGSNQTNPTSGCGNYWDVWYQFTAPAGYTFANITVTPTGSPSNLTAANTFIEAFKNNCGSLNNNSLGCSAIDAPRSLNIVNGTTYWFRLYTTLNPTGISSQYAYNICITLSNQLVGQGSRMKEVFKQTILSVPGVLADPWEVTYGPDDSLWITESKGYKVYRVSPVDGGRQTVLDISQGSTFLPAADQVFDCQFNNGTGAQGGLAGLALHPKFLDPVNPVNYVYISYIYSLTSQITYPGKTNPCSFFKNRLVRFTFNTTTKRLESPVSLCDTLPGGNDHNSQRIIIAPVNGTYYLFYAQGDLGAGQLDCRDRTQNAQNIFSYEGKILRFNLDTDGDNPTLSNLNNWIPNDNPYSGLVSKQSAVWAMGIRNNQGFAYDTTLNILYGSSHGPYSDDEINIIQPFTNYGHPLIEGYADGNYNGTATLGLNTSVSAGAPFTDNNGVSTNPPIVDEVANTATINAAGHGAYKNPLFSAYPAVNGDITTPGTIKYIWKNNPGNASPPPGWPSEAWSGLDLYSNSKIPGWKKSLIAASLKWGRLVRIRLGSSGTITVPSNNPINNAGDTIAYFGSQNRFRDLTFAPNGRDIYVVMDRSTTTSGPSAQWPVVPACNGCLQKYSFLGYNVNTGSGNRSYIPTSITIAPGKNNTCDSVNTVTINAANDNNNLWVPLTDTSSNIVAEIDAMGHDLGNVTAKVYHNGNAVRSKGGKKYLDRNITITPQIQPGGNVKIRLYITAAEYSALQGAGGSVNPSDVVIVKNNDPCGSNMNVVPTLVPMDFTTEAFGANGYVLQGTVSSFSTFYFGPSTMTTLPLNLITFKGSLRNNITLLDWETANEINTSNFLVERSTDGRNFQQIGTVTATGNTSVNNKYSYADYDVTRQSSSVVYYRLKIVDNDGSYTYSDIVTITLPFITSKVALFPNPAAHEVNVTITTAVDGKVKWQLIDNAGRIVNHSSIAAKKGNNNIVINLNRLSTGTYFLIVSGADIDQKVKLEKL